MADQGFYDRRNEFQSAPRMRRWWPRFIALLAVACGIYGAAMGAAISTTAGAEQVIGTAAAVLAVLMGLSGARFRLFVGILNRVPFARRVFAMLAAMGGAILGGLLGLMLVMPLGALPGAIGGLFLMRAILRRGLFSGFVGLMLGGCVGSIALAILRDRNAALVGMAWGLGVGVAVSPLPLLLFAKMMDSLASRRHPDRYIIDVKAEYPRKDNH